MRRFMLGLAATLVCGLLMFSSTVLGAAKTVNVSLDEFSVKLSESNLPAGTPIEFVITNNGSTVHEIVFERAGAVDVPLEVNGNPLEAEDIAPGTTKTVTWTVPEAGAFQFACHIEKHYEAGMTVEFTAFAAASAGLPSTGASGSPWGPEALAALAMLALLTIGAGLTLRHRP